MTYSNTYYGEHTTTVDENGMNPGRKDLIKVGMEAGLSIKKCEKIADGIKNCVEELLSEYLK